MIKELVQFVNEVPEFVKDHAIQPKAGLHILIDFDGEGIAKVVASERFLGKKHGEVSQFLRDCAAKQEAAWMINTNKCFDLPIKGIHSASPYCVAFKIALLKDDKDNKRKFTELKKALPSNEYKNEIIRLTSERFNSYFEKSFDPKFDLSETNKEKAIQFRNFLKKNIGQLLFESESFQEIGWDEYILIYRQEKLEAYRSFQSVYLSEGIFNTAEFNHELNGEIHGTSNFFNGFNSKKPFLQHLTAAFDITSRISVSEAKSLAEFQLYATKGLLPNPIPVFIDKSELTNEAIQFHHRSTDKKLSHREIITELISKRKDDLGNYYLLYFSGGIIKDFDYIAKFEYFLSQDKDDDGNPKTWDIENLTAINDKDKIVHPSIKLKTVFDFERIVIRELFNNSLVKIDEKKDNVSMRYFDDIDPKYYRAALYSLILKYRKPVYDYIYKSMRLAIGRQQFEDICMTGILDDLKENKDYAIRAKLNIYFSLYQYFDKTDKQYIMPSKIEDHKATIAQVVDETDAHFNTDEAYAFGAGQLIYFLLSKSESGDRTHAVLEPFLQKTNHAHFNDSIAAILLKYKHAIPFDFKRFNMLAGEVLDYIPKTSLQELRPFLLAGYFCPNIFYTKKSDS